MKNIMIFITLCGLSLTSLFGKGVVYDAMGDSIEKSTLMTAIEQDCSPEEIQELIDNGEDVNESFVYFLREIKPVLRYALDRKLDRESVEIIRILINSGADVNVITYNRVRNKALYGFPSLLSYAVIYSSAEVVQIFIDGGADVNFSEKDSKHKTPLWYAKKLNKPKVIKLLKLAGAVK